MASEHDLLADPPDIGATAGREASAVSSATWDAALVQTELAEILNPGSGSPASATSLAPSTSQAITAPRPSREPSTSGLSQLNKYLSRAWYRAGISAQLHDDSSQAVYATLLQHLGRNRFDSLIADVGQLGHPGCLQRPETSEGLAFFRAVDMVKKRLSASGFTSRWTRRLARARRPTQAAGAGAATRPPRGNRTDPQPARGRLDSRHALGKTPAEIANQWGVASKTVSNEKSRVLQKLRSRARRPRDELTRRRPSLCGRSSPQSHCAIHCPARCAVISSLPNGEAGGHDRLFPRRRSIAMCGLAAPVSRR